MPLFRIERLIPEGMTEEELDAGNYRARMAQKAFPGMKWLRSYYEPELQRTTCIYEAESADHIRQHAAMAGIPCDAVAEVVELLPEEFS